jgi:hypothetical protein
MVCPKTYFTLPNLRDSDLNSKVMIESLGRPLTVVAHDAGAANHIFSWLGDEQVKLYLTGPAQNLWQARINKKLPTQVTGSSQLQIQREPRIEIVNNNITAAVLGSNTVITGTGWESDLEHEARKIARENRIYSIAVIDHWINYADRFIRNGDQVLPDEIWVSDRYALEIAQSVFPTIRVVQLPNVYLAGLVEEVEYLQQKENLQGNERVLYVLEPIRHLWGELNDLGEFLALDYFMANLHRVCHSVDAQIRLRPHPSDPPGKYDAWISRQTNKWVSLDVSPTLAEAIAWSNKVVGCQTYAMVIALSCGRSVISTIPGWAPQCALPHDGIIKLTEKILLDY